MFQNVGSLIGRAVKIKGEEAEGSLGVYGRVLDNSRGSHWGKKDLGTKD